MRWMRLPAHLNGPTTRTCLLCTTSLSAVGRQIVVWRVGKGKVFVGQLDANLVALDANTGQVVWKVAVDPWQERWTETMAPQYVDGKVLIGASGGEFEVRGHISAYDADTGKMLWRFNTVPGPGETSNDTWAGDS